MASAKRSAAAPPQRISLASAGDFSYVQNFREDAKHPTWFASANPTAAGKITYSKTNDSNVALLNFPTNPLNGEKYPSTPLQGQSQYEREAATQTWRLLAPRD